MQDCKSCTRTSTVPTCRLRRSRPRHSTNFSARSRATSHSGMRSKRTIFLPYRGTERVLADPSRDSLNKLWARRFWTVARLWESWSTAEEGNEQESAGSVQRRGDRRDHHDHGARDEAAAWNRPRGV